jgi:hypothetical protein
VNNPFRNYPDLSGIGSILAGYSDAMRAANKNLESIRTLQQRLTIPTYAETTFKPIVQDLPDINMSAMVGLQGIEGIRSALNLPDLSAISKLAQAFDASPSPVAGLAQFQVCESLREQSTIWKRLVQPLPGMSEVVNLQAREAALTWLTGFSKIGYQFFETDADAKKLTWALRLMEPLQVYTDFSEKTLERIERETNLVITEALQDSLQLAEGQLVLASKNVPAIVDEPVEEEPAFPATSLNLLDVQQDELVASAQFTNRRGESSSPLPLPFPPAARLSEDSRNVLKLVTDCNNAMEFSTQTQIFKPTNKLLTVYLRLPWLIADDEWRLADFVDCLYWIFYEGSGSSKLRFLTVNGGVLDKSECRFIWCVKHLRNKWLRHDVEHGKDKDIADSWKKLSDELKWLKLDHFPSTSQDYRYLQRRLLLEAETFLLKIIGRLINHSQ